MKLYLSGTLKGRPLVAVGIENAVLQRFMDHEPLVLDAGDYGLGAADVVVARADNFFELHDQLVQVGFVTELRGSDS